MRTLSLANVNAEIRVYPDPISLSQAVAEELIQAAGSAVRDRGRALLALAGGSTPKIAYARLAQSAASLGAAIGGHWDGLHLFFGDEREVPPDHPDNNYRMAREALAVLRQIPAGAWHRVRTELGAVRAASDYERELRQVAAMAPGAVPRLDLILLGMGADGHTASLFPESPALLETSSLVCANWVEKLKAHRVTFTFPVLNAAAVVLFLVTGADKAGMLARVLHGLQDEQGRPFPAQLVRPASGRLIWAVDEAAARDLGGTALKAK